MTLLYGSGDFVVNLPPDDDGVTAIDAKHPDYVFYTAGSSLFRWRKRPQ